MASRSRKICLKFGCYNLAIAGEDYCKEHKSYGIEKEKERQKKYEEHRKSSSKRGYNSKWRKARESFLASNSLCVHCLANGLVTPATVVDHIIPHKGNMKLFWDKSNWQQLCASCHGIKTAKEDGGFGNEMV